MKALTGFFMAWSCFTVLPCPCRKWDEDARKYMLLFLPCIGLIIGMLWICLWLALRLAGAPAPLEAACMTVFPFIMTGGIHLDGFIDCSDAVFSRRSPEERNRILKDSHVGAFGVIVPAIMFVLYFGAMWGVIGSGNMSDIFLLLIVPFMTRAAVSADLLFLRPMEGSQYQKISGRSGRAKDLTAVIVVTAAGYLIFQICICILFPWVYGAAVLIIPLAAAAVPALLCCRGAKLLGGISGDVAGWGLIWGEVTALVLMALL